MPENLKPGMVAAIDVESVHGSVIVRANTVITTSLIKRIMVSGAMMVYVFSNPSEASKKVIMSRDAEHRREQLETELMSVIRDGIIRKEELIGMVNDAIGIAENMGSLYQYLQLLQDKNEYTYSHCISVSMLTTEFSKWMNLNKSEIEDMIVASSLHDIGKLTIDSDILEKPGKLTDDEYGAMKQHVEHGCELLELGKVSDTIKLAVAEHHERMDGMGYPNGKKWDNISEFGSMLAIVDVYDALISKRSYRDAMCPFVAMEIMHRDKFHHFRYSMLEKFIENIVYIYMGAHVELSDNRQGEIVYINHLDMLRPYVRVEGGTILNLQKIPNIKIAKVIY
ncbi:MAG: HD-GYP domain-containing protein [Defluviitaleaceae bacterium]|nr:HD-GYP domain-containing protein [Defluviitaleaceae bacterium]